MNDKTSKAPEPVAKAPEPVAKAPEPVAKAPEPKAATAVEKAEAEIVAWGDANGHVGEGLAVLRNFAPHDLIAAYDAAVIDEAS